LQKLLLKIHLSIASRMLLLYFMLVYSQELARETDRWCTFY